MFVLGLTALPLAFQNCGKPPMNEEASSELAVLEIDSLHVDREHGTEESMEKPRVEATAEDLIADRVLVLNKLKFVFGPLVGNLSFDQDRIIDNKAEFGSPCSLYDGFNYELPDGRVSLSDLGRNCTMQSGGSALNARLLPSASTTRQGIMGHLCLALSADVRTRSHALQKIQTQGIPAGTPENVLKAFRLFYRFTPEPPVSLIQSLQVMMPESDISSESWAPVLYTLCISNAWQVL